jgi:hypothetical protein
LVAELRANNQQLTSLGMVTPIIATIKNIIDNKNKNDNSTNQFFNNYSFQDKISREQGKQEDE